MAPRDRERQRSLSWRGDGWVGTENIKSEVTRHTREEGVRKGRASTKQWGKGTREPARSPGTSGVSCKNRQDCVPRWGRPQTEGSSWWAWNATRGYQAIWQPSWVLRKDPAEGPLWGGGEGGAGPSLFHREQLYFDLLYLHFLWVMAWRKRRNA